MKRNAKPIRPPVKWHGGKHYLAKKIVAFFPDHHSYIEPFGGAGSVLLNKKPSEIEVFNDLDTSITRLFQVLRDHGPVLLEKLSLTPYSELEFELAAEETDDEIEMARRNFVRWRQSFGGQGKSFSYTLHRVRNQLPDVVSGFLSSIDENLPLIVERLRGVQIMNREAIEVIKKWDSEKSLIYADPPYLPETRASKAVYAQELTRDEHIELATTLNACKSKVILSGYHSELYDELYAAWHRVEFDMALHSAGGETKARKKEVLWMNFLPPNTSEVEV